MVAKVKAVKGEITGRISAVKCEIKNKITGHLDRFIPLERRETVMSALWVAGRFLQEFFSVLGAAAGRFVNFLARVATFWQVVFLKSRYKNVFAAGGLFSIIMAIAAAPEFLLIIPVLIIVPFFFACLCAIAAGAVLKFICLFFEFMPPLVWAPVVAALLAFVAFRAYVRTELAWREKKGVV